MPTNVKWGGGLEKYTKRLEEVAKVSVKIGILNGAKYPDGVSVATVAYANENGAWGNPRRPFMHRTFKKHSAGWVRGILRAINDNVDNPSIVRKAFEMAGMTAAGQMKEVIRKWNPSDPRLNSEKTIEGKRRRGRSGRNLVPIKPEIALIDTGHMINSIDYEVKTK